MDRVPLFHRYNILALCASKCFYTCNPCVDHIKGLVNCCILEVILTVYLAATKYPISIIFFFIVCLCFQKETVALSTMAAVTSQQSASEQAPIL